MPDRQWLTILKTGHDILVSKITARHFQWLENLLDHRRSIIPAMNLPKQMPQQADPQIGIGIPFAQGLLCTNVPQAVHQSNVTKTLVGIEGIHRHHIPR